MACGSLNTLTGRGGEFYAVVPNTATPIRIARVTAWSVNPTLGSSSEWGDSDTAGYTARQPGRRDATFTADGKYDVSDEVVDTFKAADRAACVLWMDGTKYWDFPCAICTDFSLSVDVDSEEVIGWTSSWGADGIFYAPGQAGATARTQT